MKKRIIVKIVMCAAFLSFGLLTCFAGGAFATVREGFNQALNYNFEIDNIANDLGVDFLNNSKDDSHLVGGEGSVVFYCEPVMGDISMNFYQTGKCVEYRCNLVLTVKAACDGKVHDIVQNGDFYDVTIKNPQGYLITVSKIKNIYISYGDEVTSGQIIGSLNKKGLTEVCISKNGIYYDPIKFFQ